MGLLCRHTDTRLFLHTLIAVQLCAESFKRLALTTCLANGVCKGSTELGIALEHWIGAERLLGLEQANTRRLLAVFLRASSVHTGNQLADLLLELAFFFLSQCTDWLACSVGWHSAISNQLLHIVFTHASDDSVGQSKRQVGCFIGNASLL